MRKCAMATDADGLEDAPPVALKTEEGATSHGRQEASKS